jgi:putative cell wall-binding protein
LVLTVIVMAWGSTGPVAAAPASLGGSPAFAPNTDGHAFSVQSWIDKLNGGGLSLDDATGAPGSDESGPTDLRLQPSTFDPALQSATAPAASDGTASPAAVTYNIKGKVTNASAVGLDDIDVYLIHDADRVYVTTSGGGNYSAAVEPGVYFALFWDPNYDYGTGYYGGPSGFTLDWNEVSRIVVTSSDVTVDITLPPQFWVFGRITNSSGSGLEHMLVESWVDGFYYDYWDSVSDGYYYVPAVPGSVTLFFYDEAGVYAGGWRSGTGITHYWDQATAIALDDEAHDVNVTLPTARHIKGKVQPTASGLATVYAYSAGEEVGWTDTASDGSYSIPVIPGSYTLSVDPPYGYAGGWRTSSGFTADRYTVSAVTVSATADLTGINLTLPAARYISGTVVNPGLSSLQGIEVDVYHSNGGFYTWAYTDAAGAYSIPVAAGTYRVSFYDEEWEYAGGWYNSTNGTGFAHLWADSSVVSTVSSDATLVTAQLPAMAVPSRPNSVTAVAYNQSAVVSWTPNVMDGGSWIENYVVTASPDGATCESDWYYYCTVTGLTNGTAYTFTVVAQAPVGDSLASNPSSGVTPAAVPDAPGSVRAVGANGSVTVSWAAPADNGSAITGYTVTASPGGGGCTWTSGPLTCTVTGLTNGAYKWFDVAATNANGTGPEGISNGAVANPKLVRYGSTNIYATAAAISANTFPADCYCTAYIAYGGNFPDALAGAAAAGSVPGPVLFVATTGAINTSTAAELTRLQPSQIVVLGSELVISLSVYNALHAYGPVYRDAGNDRFGTATTVSWGTFGTNCDCTVYIAYAMNFPDALAAAAAAGTVPGPVLLIATTGTLNASTTAELNRLKPSKIVALGSTVVISATVLNALKAYAPTGQTFRYYGTSRYDTAASISSHTFSSDCGCVAYISAGTDFHGALSGAAAAGWINGPLLLVGTTGAIPPSTAAELTRLKPVRIVVLGGTDKVSVAVFNALAPYAPAP